MRRFRWLLFLLGAQLVAAGVHFSNALVPDRDSFYHFRHGALYAERGPFLAEFPWPAYSVIARENSDLWYGFHLLLAPFGSVPDPVLGLKLAAVVVLTLSLGFFYWAVARLEARWPELWTLLMLTCAAPALLRMLALRPQVLSLALIALLFSFAVRGRPWQIALAAAALAWVHLNLAWVGLGAVLLVLALRSGIERSLHWRPLLAATAGLTTGWLLRPNPLGAARLAWVQVPVLLQVRQEGVPLLWGGEMSPRPALELVTLFLPLVLLLLGCAALAWSRRAAWRSFATAARAGFLAALTLAVGFGGLTFFHSARSLDLWKTFAILFCALIAGRAATGGRSLGALVLVQVWMLTQLAFPPGRAMLGSGFRPHRLRAHASWLAAHSEAGDVVFHARWEVFSELFFWNTRNRYINGMDPIFLYARTPALYWEMHHLASGASRYTFGGPVPRGLGMDDTVSALRRDFRARYVLVEADQRELLYYARHEPRLRLRYEDREASLFELVPR